MDLAQCTICQEFLEFKNDDIVAGICGHVFHYLCLSQWRENADTCPQCRTRYAGREPIKLYFDLQAATEADGSDPAVLQNKVRDLNFKLEEKEKEIKEHKGKIKASKKELSGVKAELGAVRGELDRSSTVNSALKQQLSFLEKHKEEAARSIKTAERLQRNLDKLQNVELLINGEKEDVELMLRNFNNSPEALNQIITSFVIMKKEFEKLKTSKEKMNDDKKKQRKEIDELRRKVQASFDDYGRLQAQLKLAETDIEHMERERQNLLAKINSLEKAFASTSPRTNLLRRLLKESPAPFNAKRKRCTPLEESENSENSAQGDYIDLELENENKEDMFSDSFNDFANEIQLKMVTTTSVTNRMRKTGVPDNRKVLSINNTAQKNVTSSSSSTSCPVIQKGYNGLGGQSRFVKPSFSKNLSRKVKVPKSSALKKSSSIDQTFFVPRKTHPLPDFNISPS